MNRIHRDVLLAFRSVLGQGSVKITVFCTCCISRTSLCITTVYAKPFQICSNLERPGGSSSSRHEMTIFMRHCCSEMRAGPERARDPHVAVSIHHCCSEMCACSTARARALPEDKGPPDSVSKPSRVNFLYTQAKLAIDHLYERPQRLDNQHANRCSEQRHTKWRIDAHSP